MNRRALSGVLVALALVAAACNGDSKDDSEEDASRPEGSTTLTTAAPTTTSATAAAEPAQPSVVADASGLGGVAMGEPAGDLFERLTAAFGPPTRDTGFIPNDCFAEIAVRWVRWSDFVVAVADEPPAGDLTLWAWYVGGDDVPDGVEVPAGVSMDTTWGELSSRGATWGEGLWFLDGLHGTVEGDLFELPPDDARVNAIGDGSTQLQGC